MIHQLFMRRLSLMFAILTSLLATPIGSAIADEEDALQSIREANPTKLQVEYYAALKERCITVERAANEVLASDADEEVAVKIVEEADRMFSRLLSAGYKGSSTYRTRFREKLLKDPRRAVQLIGRYHELAGKLSSYATIDADGKRKMDNEVLEFFGEVKINLRHMALAVSFCKLMDYYADDPEHTAATALKIVEMAKGSTERGVPEYTEILFGFARRVMLMGKTIEWKGVNADGKPVSQADFAGKVVLIDFWASWCSPCIRELPNVKAMYAAYHDRGFEVIGVNVDRSSSLFSAFVRKYDVPWGNLYADGKQIIGFKHPMAVHYDVTSIPTVILLDRDGKVVHLRARGSDLRSKLAELLGPIEDTDAAE